MAEEPQKASSSTSQQPSSSDKKPDEDAEIKPQDPDHGVSPKYPSIVPGSSHGQYDEHTNRGAGVYAVPVHQFGGHVAGLPSNYLIPLTYNVPTTRPGNETEAGGENQAQGGQGQQQQQQPAGQREVVVRRFEIAFQLDIFLILKLAAVIYLFNQDGSRQRLAVLVIFATIIYLYQTGALAPFIRWLSQGMHRAAIPPPPPRAQRPAARADNDPAAAMPLNQDAAPEGQENEAGDGNRANANENVDAAGQQGNQWWGIVKEIQMIVFGFITSLLPGFHNIE
ncbi:Transmembrane protein [Hirschfeldia incana]|nr:Transmembrane protein [Hirschfeldia incana]